MRHGAAYPAPPTVSDRKHIVARTLEWMARDPSTRPPSRAVRILVLALVGIALFAFLKAGVHQYQQQFLPFYAYAIAAIWYGDTWEGLTAVAGSAIAIAVLRISQLSLGWIAQDIQIEVLFLGSSLLLVYVMHSLRRARAEAQRARAVAEAAVATRDSFLATVSHDLKNPLLLVTLRAQLLQHQYSQTPPPDGARLLAELSAIDSAAGQMKRMIDDLLDLARLQEGAELALDVEQTNLTDLTSRIIAEHEQLARRHTIEAPATAAPLVGYWDARRLERVLGNLLSNAIKYSPDGSVVSVDIAADGEGWARLTVRDRGCGIPAADLPHIFERFHRGANVGKAPGTGLGLAAARQVVEQHGGTITVASAESVGTTVAVRLPLRPPHGTGPAILEEDTKPR